MLEFINEHKFSVIFGIMLVLIAIIPQEYTYNVNDGSILVFPDSDSSKNYMLDIETAHASEEKILFYLNTRDPKFDYISATWPDGGTLVLDESCEINAKTKTKCSSNGEDYWVMAVNMDIHYNE